MKFTLAPLRRIERRMNEFGPRPTLGFEDPGLATKTRGVFTPLKSDNVPLGTILFYGIIILVTIYCNTKWLYTWIFIKLNAKQKIFKPFQSIHTSPPFINEISLLELSLHEIAPKEKVIVNVDVITKHPCFFSQVQLLRPYSGYRDLHVCHILSVTPAINLVIVQIKALSRDQLRSDFLRPTYNACKAQPSLVFFSFPASKRCVGASPTVLPFQ